MLNDKPTNDLDRATAYTVMNIVDYVPNSLETVRIISKTTGSVTIVAVDGGVNTGTKISPFDTLVYILEGSAEVKIDRKSHHLGTGQCIIIPAHFRSHLVSEAKFKMLLTVIKSGYES